MRTHRRGQRYERGQKVHVLGWGTHRRGQRYERGQKVHVLGWGVLDTATVTAVLTIRGWPYYEVLATNDASVWLVPRIHCSTIPLPVQ